MRSRLSELQGNGCDVRTDDLTRELYATDASLYRIKPAAVAFPKSAREAAGVLKAAAEASIPITPRGSGSGLAGGAIGEGLIVDFARHLQQITDFDAEKATVRAGAGVILDQLNAFLQPRGFCFGPDVATSSRATIGGMIANNSSGARAPIYGVTADHVRGVEIATVAGDIRQYTLESSPTFPEHEVAVQAVASVRSEIHARMPAGLLKRWPGYGLDRFLREPNLANILAGSEGTLAGILTAELRITPLPREKALALLFFRSVEAAMEATVNLLDLNAAAIEHIDRVLTDQTVGQLQFRKARDFLELDSDPAESILIVEFYENATDKLAALESRPLGYRKKIARTAQEMNLVWGLRKAGVALLTGCKGPAKPVTCIEDATVRPEKLPAFVASLKGILRPLGVEACFYGHAASGLLHVRPVLDLHKPEDLTKLRKISDEFSALVREFHGSLASEHGVGIARTEYMREHLGEPLLGVMRQIKSAFDPSGVLNPGKIIPDGRYKIDQLLRREPGLDWHLPFEPVLEFAAKDGSFIANLEQCNGCGGCRKLTPGMCPTYRATGDERMSTRGRANLIRAALDGRFELRSAELLEVLNECLSCKACNTECPSNVNLSLLKAELLHARIQERGLSFKECFFSSIDLLGKIGTLLPAASNRAQSHPAIRNLLYELLGLTRRRALPAFASERFDDWFRSRGRAKGAPRGKVYLWDDCFARYYEPEIGRAAVRVLEAAGFEVNLVQDRACCGRPAFSQGNLSEAARLGRINLHKIRALEGPILFLEPSCHSMFAEDYRELGLKGAEEIAPRAWLIERFLEDLLEKEGDALRFPTPLGRVRIHPHCHVQAASETSYLARLLSRVPGTDCVAAASGCCGMAGSFGALEKNYSLSAAIAEPLIKTIEKESPETWIAASGTSCRQQISHFSSRRPLHPIELLVRSLES